jgi:eukaryotic-like serine/threonine-protein kinase
MAENDKEDSARRTCPQCGAELPDNVPPERCPKCLLKAGLSTQPMAGPGGTAAGPAAKAKSPGLPQPGDEFGHYRVVRLLGAGGMGAVFDAEDLESGRRVALKVLSHTLDSPEARERFLREGRLAASINHPNSVYVFGTEEVGGTPVIAMELVTGGTLQDRVSQQGPLPVGEAVDCILQIVAGLEAAQRIGVLHRDIKPSNCFRDADGTVKIGDFGLSISTSVRTEPALTAAGAFLGTPAFSSPEQLRGDELNARSDMYSVGVTLFYLLTGHTPFEAKNMVQLLATVLEQRPPSPRKLRANIPQGLAKAVLRCLEKQPGDRFKHYADLMRALAPYSATAPTPATLGLRFLAGVVDMAILNGLAVLINLSVFGTPMAFLEQAMRLAPKALACVLGWMVVSILYFALFEGLWGAAAGKALCRLRVVGSDRNPPGFTRACFRALVYVLPPLLPYWAAFGANPKAYMSASQLTQTLLGGSIYVVMALLFVSARRRNGFAALQDLLTRTRVISRAAVTARPALPASEPPPPSVESAVTIGPYHVLQALTEADNGKWFLAYDLKLLRKVWLRVVPPGTQPVPVPLRNLGRVGRLRWLTGKRSPEENWDAFEALTGRSFLELIGSPQPWSEARYWLHDLAMEISAAEKDGTGPELTFDRIWITGEGRAKLLDFPAPGLAPRHQPNIQPSNAFLSAVAGAALSGRPDSSAPAAGDVAAPLPLHARAFLKSLPQMAGADAVAATVKPLLNRVPAVSRWRRAALVGGCMVFPVLACGGGIFAMTFLQDLTRKNPGLMDLNTLLHMRTSAPFWGGKKSQMPTDRQIEIYIAHHHRGLITNAATWSSPFVLAMIKGKDRTFAERSVADYPAPTQTEIAEADAMVGKHLPKEQLFAGKPPPALAVTTLAMSLVFYVGLPALVAALLFRGGVVLLIAGVTYVRKDGVRASRLRLLWRAMVVWSPSLLVFTVSMLAIVRHWTWQPWLALALLGLLAAASLALPERGLPDRLAGTWPVPR